MKQIAVNVNDPPSSILLGRQGEHLATRVVFDCTDFAALYGVDLVGCLLSLFDGVDKGNALLVVA